MFQLSRPREMPLGSRGPSISDRRLLRPRARGTTTDTELLASSSEKFSGLRFSLEPWAFPFAICPPTGVVSGRPTSPLCGRRVSGSKPWGDVVGAEIACSTDCGLWPEACGPCPVAGGLQHRIWPVAYSMACGLWPTAWHMAYRLQHGIWPMAYSMACGLWPTAWHVAYGLQQGMWPMAYSMAPGL